MLIASEYGHLEVCEWLFKMGAAMDIRKVDGDARCPMWWACANGHLPICKWLFEVGAEEDVTTADKDGKTPMIAAAYNGHLSVCKWLYESGAKEDTTKADHMGYTPLFLSCQQKHRGVFQWLFQVDATKQWRNGEIHRQAVEIVKSHSKEPKKEGEEGAREDAHENTASCARNLEFSPKEVAETSATDESRVQGESEAS